MADQLTLRQPALITPPAHRRLNGALAAGTVTANAGTYQEVIALGPNVRYLTIRACVATANCTLNFDFVAPTPTGTGFYLTNGQIDPTKVTAYGDSLKPAQVTVTAGPTPAVMQVTTNGEWYGLVTLTGTGAGTITYVDVAAL